MTSHSPESIDCLLSDPKETPPKFGTHACLPKEPFPYHCQKRQMAIYGAYFHTKPLLASLSILRTSFSSSALFTQPSSLILVTRTLTLLSPPFRPLPHVLSSLLELSHLHLGAACVCVLAVCPLLLEPSV